MRAVMVRVFSAGYKVCANWSLLGTNLLGVILIDSSIQLSAQLCSERVRAFFGTTERTHLIGSRETVSSSR
jgi:hypothetical protein